MNNRYVRNYLILIEEKYKKDYLKNKKFNRLFTAFKLIEMDNRKMLWRLIEYIALFFDVSLIRYTNYITNYSIGKVQLKVSMIFNYHNIAYEIQGKRLYLSRRVPVTLLIRLLFMRKNDEDIFENYFIETMGHDNTVDLKEECLSKFALSYSRNNEFIGNLNYYVVLKHLYYNTFDYLKSFS